MPQLSNLASIIFSNLAWLPPNKFANNKAAPFEDGTIIASINCSTVYVFSAVIGVLATDKSWLKAAMSSGTFTFCDNEILPDLTASLTMYIVINLVVEAIGKRSVPFWSAITWPVWASTTTPAFVDCRPGSTNAALALVPTDANTPAAIKPAIICFVTLRISFPHSYRATVIIP